MTHRRVLIVCLMRLAFQLPDSRNSAQFIESHTLEVGHSQTMLVLMVAGILIGGFTNTIILAKIVCSSQRSCLPCPTALVRQGTSTHAPLIPTLTFQVERGASRLVAKQLERTRKNCSDRLLLDRDRCN